MIKYILILISLLISTACARTVNSTLLPATFTPTPTTPIRPTSTNQPEQSPTAAPSPTLQTTRYPNPSISDEAGPLYETILQIPVGEDGIQYRGAGVTDMEPVGPNGIVITPDGVIVIGDVYGNRLMRYRLTGERLNDIDLAEMEILNISDLVGIDDSLYILEISFKVLPERYRVDQLTIGGQLVRQYDLPEGFHFEDGLYGLAVGYPTSSEPEILIQLGNADDSIYYRLPDAPDGLPEKLPALPVFGEKLSLQSAQPEELAVLTIGAQEFESQMTAGGTIFLLAARGNGSLFLERDDLVAWEPITTDITIHYVTANGAPAGLARYPLMDWYFHIWRFLTVGPDGNVYGLITREKSVDILRLIFYGELAPLLSRAANPSITSLSPDLTLEPTYDCTKVQHITADSPEAEQIVKSFIANYLQDWPTEYMALEQLWSVDRTEDYALIQGMVTPEESDIIVVEGTERGFVMVYRFQSNSYLPGFRHADISGYLAAQLPNAPVELFYCPDLSRFVNESE